VREADDDGGSIEIRGSCSFSSASMRSLPDDHLVRQISSVLDLSWVHAELSPYYSSTGRPSIDPVLMIRMLIVG
jgi:transposase